MLTQPTSALFLYFGDLDSNQGQCLDSSLQVYPRPSAGRQVRTASTTQLSLKKEESAIPSQQQVMAVSWLQNCIFHIALQRNRQEGHGYCHPDIKGKNGETRAEGIILNYQKEPGLLMSSPCSQALSLPGQYIQTKNKSTFLFSPTKKVLQLFTQNQSAVVISTPKNIFRIRVDIFPIKQDATIQAGIFTLKTLMSHCSGGSNSLELWATKPEMGKVQMTIKCCPVFEARFEK